MVDNNICQISSDLFWSNQRRTDILDRKNEMEIILLIQKNHPKYFDVAIRKLFVSTLILY